MADLPDILKAIVARKREEVASARSSMPLAVLKRRVADLEEPPRGFVRTLRGCVESGWTAVIAEVSIENGQVKVHDIWQAIDPGSIVNPAIVEAQVNGAVALGLQFAISIPAYMANGMSLPEALAAGLREKVAQARIAGVPDLVKLKLRELAPSASPQSRTFRARYTIASTPPGLRMGVTAHVQLAGKDATPSAPLPSV
mgnify:CR=1 FL=1